LDQTRERISGLTGTVITVGESTPGAATKAFLISAFDFAATPSQLKPDIVDFRHQTALP
jgi:hypothetical protein